MAKEEAVSSSSPKQAPPLLLPLPSDESPTGSSHVVASTTYTVPGADLSPRMTDAGRAEG